MAWVPTLAAVGVASAVSLVGAFALLLPGMRRHRFLLVLVAVAAGALVGDALFHLLPEAAHAWEEEGLDHLGLWIAAGFLTFFGFEVALRSRHAHAERADDTPQAHLHAGEALHAHDTHAAGHPGQVSPFAWTNLAGDAVHNFLDGAVIAAAFLVDTPVGIATTIAVIIHEVPQELGDFAVLLRAGLPARRALLFNFLSGVVAVLGAVLVLLLPFDPGLVERFGMPLIVGAFLYIAAADLIPELHHHSRGREALLILACFVVGLALMYGLLGLESAGLLGAGDHGHG